MATIFLLGPSEWDPARGAPPSRTPFALRLAVAREMRAHGHDVVLMEQVGDEPGEDMVDKFDRILRREAVTDIVVLWPKGAKMQTTYDELLLLRDRVSQDLPRVWVLHHAAVAEIRRGVFRLKEPGGRSRYLDSVARLGVRPLSWSTASELDTIARRLSRELGR